MLDFVTVAALMMGSGFAGAMIHAWVIADKLAARKADLDDLEAALEKTLDYHDSIF